MATHCFTVNYLFSVPSLADLSLFVSTVMMMSRWDYVCISEHPPFASWSLQMIA